MIEGKPITMPGAIRFTVDSDHVGDQFEVRVFQPPRLPPAAEDMGVQIPDAFRVIYTLDANMGFAGVVGTTQVLPGDPDGGPCEYLIVVGIGYPLDQLIRQEFPCLPDKAGLFGFSYVGLFALYALFSRSPTFDRYIAGSPASVIEGDVILECEERCWVEGPELNAQAFITLGSLERTSKLSGLQLLATNYDKLIARLEERNYKGLEWSAQEFENESHMSYTSMALSHGLRRLFPGEPSPMMRDVRKQRS